MGRNYLTLITQKGNPIPQIINWYGKLDIRNVNRKDYKKIPKPLILEMRTGVDAIYPDIMTSPILMASEEAMEVILLYDKQMPFFFLVLFESEKGKSITYYCPILAEGSNNDTEAIYYIKLQERNEIKICEELAESLLERGVIGMGLVNNSR